ncbi:hypothetical protein [Deinococcus altitudinis]|uniref:hypothetical protein n=1 Tax=Deinococcus altitudinis TaxID=468914 RepID=UPI003892BF3F
MTLATGISNALPMGDLRARAAVLRVFRAQAHLTPDQRYQTDCVLNGLASLMVKP